MAEGDPVQNQVSGAPGTGPTGGIDIGAIVANAGQALSASMKDLISSVPSGGQGQALVGKGADIKAQGEIAVSNANETAAIKLQQDNLSAAARFGVQPGAVSGTGVTLANKINSDELDLIQRREMVLKKQDTSFLDDPIGFITNQITLPYESAALETRQSGVTQELAVLRGITEAASEQAQVNATIDTGASAARRDGLANQALGAALLEKGQAAFQSAQIGVEAANVRVAANRTMFDGAVATSAAIGNQARLNLEATGMALDTKKVELQEANLVLQKISSVREGEAAQRATEEHTMQMQIQSMQSADMQTRMTATAAMQQRLDNVSKVTGMSKMTVGEFSMMGPGPLRSAIEAASVDPNVQNGGRLGSDVVNSLNYATSANLPLTPGGRQIEDKLVDLKQGIIESSNPYIWKTLDPDVQHLKLFQGIQQDMTKQLSNIQDTGSIYSPAPLSHVLNIPVVAQTDLAKDLAPLTVADPKYATRPEDFVTAALLRIQNGKSTPAEMADQISTIYRGIMTDNDFNRPYTKFGLPSMNEQGNFKTTVNVGNSYMGSQIIDMSSRAAVEAYLTRNIIIQRQQQLIYGTPGMSYTGTAP